MEGERKEGGGWIWVNSMDTLTVLMGGKGVGNGMVMERGAAKQSCGDEEGRFARGRRAVLRRAFGAKLKRPLMRD